MAASTGAGGIAEGRVFDLERYSTHDGPGIRTTLFLKGCALRCSWCHNPESIDPRPELLYDPAKCRLDLGCVLACPQDAIQFLTRDGEPITKANAALFRGRSQQISGRRHDPEACIRCGRCAEVCFPRALELAGRTLTVADAVAQLAQDQPFYQRSGGGITLSGGEPLCQPAFATAVLAGCRARGLHTALDTTAYATWSVLAAAMEHVDLVLLDLKHMDPLEHHRLTGVDNAVIRRNASRLATLLQARQATRPVPSDQRQRYGMWVRVPLIPGANDDDANARAAARFVRQSLGVAVTRVELLGYHVLGRAKLERLGRPDPGLAWTPPTPEHLASRRRIWEEELAGTAIAVAAR